MQMLSWAPLPTAWIEAGGLKVLKWADKDRRSDYIAALMVLIALAHRADRETMAGRMTYDELTATTHLSRFKVSNGLKILEEFEIIARKPKGESTYQFPFKEKDRWGKLPARGLYKSGSIAFLAGFNLRKRVELDALKIYLLFVTRKSFDRNVVELSYAAISQRTGISEAYVANAVNYLAQLGLIRVDYTPLDDRIGKISVYRITYLEPQTTRRVFTETDAPGSYVPEDSAFSLF